LATLLVTADNVIPTSGKVRDQLTTYINETPISTFVEDQLRSELLLQRYSDIPSVNLTEIGGYEDPKQVAERLVDQISSLPWQYKLTTSYLSNWFRCSFVRRFICCWGASMTTRTCRNVRRSKLDWVIVRPVILTNGPNTNAYRALVNPRRWTWGFISRADVADFLVKQINDDAFLHKTSCSRADANAAQHLRFVPDARPHQPGAGPLQNDAEAIAEAVQRPTMKFVRPRPPTSSTCRRCTAVRTPLRVFTSASVLR
jgi:hypothetical protein